MSTFYVVATPIGNLGDITFRAAEVLKMVDVVFCEDTRVTRKLFGHYGIRTRMASYHAHSASSRAGQVAELLKEGKNVALVTDAGTPGISDPGAELVRHIRHWLADEIAGGSVRMESVPGASALTAALSVAGAPSSEFIFLGFLPHKKGRQTLFKEMAASLRTIVFYESPHRILKTLESLSEYPEFKVPGSGGKKITICRELTKIFEEVVSGTSENVATYFWSHPEKVRGEFVVIISEYF